MSMKTQIIFYCLMSGILLACTKPAEKETGFIRAGKLTIYYERQGEGPPVLLLHAGLQDHRMWEPQVNFIKKNHQVITVDLPAQGKSSGVDSTIFMADVLIKVLDGLEVDRVTVIGLSYGSSSATDLVLAYPERIDKVVLVSAGLTGWDKVLQADTISTKHFALLDTAFNKEEYEKTAELFTKAWCDGPFRKPEEVKEETRAYIYFTTLANLRDHDKDSWAKFSEITAAERISQLKKPVLIVYGDKDLPIIRTVSQFLHEKIEGSKIVEMPGVAHMLNMEAPEEFNKIVSRFID